MVAPLVVATEAVGWLGTRWKRRLSWRWTSLFAALTVACLLVWGAVRGAPIGRFGLRARDLAQNLGYLVQGLIFLSAPLAQVLAAGTGLSPETAVWIVALPTLLGLASCAVRNGRSTALLGAVWFALFAVPPLVAMEADWFALAPRFLYTTAPGVALLWTAAFAPTISRLLGRIGDKPGLATLIALATTACLLAPAMLFVRRGMELYTMAGAALWDAARVGVASQPVLLVNLPRRITPARRVYALGFEGITPLPQRVTAAELVYVHTGVRNAGNAVAFGIVAVDVAADYAYELHGPEVGWVEIADAARDAAAVYLTQYRGEEIRVVEAGGPAQNARSEEADAVFEGRIVLRGARGECDEAGHIRLTTEWQALVPVPTDVAVFAHLARSELEDGRPIRQADGYPLLGMRPFWLFEAQEAVHDVRYFAPVAAGSYLVKLGLFEPGTSLRWGLDGISGENAYSVSIRCK
jgi:hypothetical protein